MSRGSVLRYRFRVDKRGTPRGTRERLSNDASSIPLAKNVRYVYHGKGGGDTRKLSGRCQFYAKDRRATEILARRRVPSRYTSYPLDKFMEPFRRPIKLQNLLTNGRAGFTAANFNGPFSPLVFHGPQHARSTLIDMLELPIYNFSTT